MSSGKNVAVIPEVTNVQDPEARRWMASVTDMLKVRNGDSGNGDHAFLTKVDLEALIGTDNFKILTDDGVHGNANNAGGYRAPSVLNTIRALQRQIGGSPLSVYLAETIALIKRPKTGVLARIDTITVQFAATEDTVAAVQTQIQTLTNSFSATAILVNTIQSRIDNATGPGSAVTIEQKFTTLVTNDNFLFAQYTVKIDLNGYVVGFGLMAIDNGAGPSSLFLVRADTFAIGAPGLNSQIPFIVKTTPFINDAGALMPAGMYVTRAFIADFVAETGNIGALTVGSLKIKNEAVTVPGAARQSGSTTLTSAFVAIAAVSLDFSDENGNPITTRAAVQGIFSAYPSASLLSQVDIRIEVVAPAGTYSNSFGQTMMAGQGGTVNMMESWTVSGSCTFTLYARLTPGAANPSFTCSNGVLLVTGTKK